jgi:hypothetical protein
MIAQELGCERKSNGEMKLKVALFDINESHSLFKLKPYKTPRATTEVILS